MLKFQKLKLIKRTKKKYIFPIECIPESVVFTNLTKCIWLMISFPFRLFSGYQATRSRDLSMPRWLSQYSNAKLSLQSYNNK